MSYSYVSFNRLHWPKGEKNKNAKLEQTATLTSDLGYTLWYTKKLWKITIFEWLNPL